MKERDKFWYSTSVDPSHDLGTVTEQHTLAKVFAIDYT